MKIGFIGLGQMGSHMARRLLEAGYDLTVNDINQEAARLLLDKGAKWSDSPEVLARSCELVISMLPGPPEVEQVVYGPKGLMGGWKKGDVYMDMSTSLPTTTRRVAKDAGPKGVAVLDAPVSGGADGAEAGTLSIMVGGNPDERVKGVLEHLGKTIFYMGDTGCGNITKIVNNLIAITCNNITDEAFVLGARAGIDAGKLREAVIASSGNNVPLRKTWATTVLKGNFEGGFQLNLALKDVNLAMALAGEYGIPLPISATVEQRLFEAKAEGLGKKAFQSTILRLEELAKVKVRFSD